MRNNTYQTRHNQSINKNNTKTPLKETKKVNFRTIYDLYKSNFINNCELILLEKQNTFLDNFFNKMKLIIKSEYEEDIFEKNKIIYEITKKCENYFISDIYWPMYDTCSNGFQKFKSSYNKNKDFYLTNFLSHCNYEQIALHYCGSKLIKISSKINTTDYAICSGCKKCYFNSCIPIYCPFSQKKYFSRITKESEDTLEPATWLEYHCKNPIVNEQMSCIRCGDKFWIKKNKLFCKNCKFEVDPLLILWTCTICKKEFRSSIKKYNPLEYRDVENAIKEAFLNKKIVKPEDFPCKCFKNKDIRNYDFCHKIDGLCKGVMYYSTLKNEEILVCSLCNCIFFLNKFYWNCPICARKFKSNNILIQTNTNNLEPITRMKSHKFKKNMNATNSGNILDNEDKILLYLSSKGTPLRDINKYDINYNNMLNSYVKKKPNDSYFNNSNSRKREDQHNRSYLESKNKRRNLSINLTNKINTNISENENNYLNDTCSINEKDNKYNTNSNFYLKNNALRESKKDIIDRNSKYLTKNSVDNQAEEFFSPLKNENEKDKNYFKIQLTTKASKRYNGISDSRRYASTSTRNYYHNQDNGNTFVNYKNERNNPNTSVKKRKYERYFPNDTINAKNDNNDNIKNNQSKNIQIYIPKKKIDLNKSNIIISSPINQHNRRNKLNSNNSKASLAKSVGIRERYKKINVKNNNNNYEKRNLKTMQEDDYNEDDKKGNIFSGQMQPMANTKTNNEYYKEIKSSSQCKIDKEKYKNANLSNFSISLKYEKNESSSKIKKPKNENYSKNNHKYNKRYIGNICNPNYITINTTSSNIYNRTSNNFNYKDKTGTNKSNGGDNISENNVTINDDNNSDKMNKNKKLNENNFHSVRREKRYIMDKSDLKDEKEFNERKSFKEAKINNNNIINSFKNGGKILNENESQRKFKTVNVDEKHDENNELKEFNFNDYKIITQLGQGTFGKIYLVQDKNNQLFSMKKIILSEELDVHAVIKEYRMCQKLKHSNVVKILGIYNNKLDLTTYVVYVLMEVGLTDWEKEIRSYNDKSLEYTEQELIQIIKQLSSVLSFLQRNNISHRDIKPQNILVFKNGIYKVADFGEAKQIDNIAKNLINFSLRGTELYMSPLLFNGLRTGQIDIKHNLFKSDVYSLGLCILYAAVRNNKPLYEIRKYVDMAEIKRFLDKLLKGKYSQKFLSLLISMLEIHEKNRPDFIELEKTMQNWV